MYLELSHLKRSFGEKTVVEDLTLSLPQGELLCILGSSGCGKTTTLNMIGGFLAPDSGQILLDGEDITAIPPERRPVTTVFQSYGLFPHMTVLQNVLYGLKFQHIRRSEAREKGLRYLDMVGLTDYAGAYIYEISGGQQQRVALARALIVEPKLCLLDEPFSNLDAALRVKMRRELKTLQRELGMTMVFVTHDQEECFSISDKVAVMNGGVIEQFDTPENIYKRPATEFVARFIGFENFLELAKKQDGVYTAPDGSEFLTSVDLDCEKFAGTIRPDDICLADDVQTENVLSGKIGVRTFLGKSYQYEVETSAGVLKVNMGTDHVYKEGEEIRLYLPKDKLILVRR